VSAQDLSFSSTHGTTQECDARLADEADALRARLEAIENSTIWQATRPIRSILASTPPWMRRAFRRGRTAPSLSPIDALGHVSDAPADPGQAGVVMQPGSAATMAPAAVSEAVPERHGSLQEEIAGSTDAQQPTLGFDQVSDETWLEMLIAAAEARLPPGQQLPPFPAPEWQAMFVGSSNSVAMREAFTFYKLLKRLMERNGTPIGRETQVLDFGCGWGRYIRLLMKDVGAGALHGADVDFDMIGFCRISGLPAKFAVMKPFGPTEYADGAFDLIFAYSVFSHLCEEAHGLWMQEFARILQPGGLLVFTTQARRFLEWTVQLRARPESELSIWEQTLRSAFPDLNAALTDYDAGRFVFAPTGGGAHRPSSFYGEAAIPEGYLRRVKPDSLNLVECIDDVKVCPQAVAVLRRTV
jgi:SAM-dependent methyltransferase